MNTSLEGIYTNAVRYLKYVYVRVLVFLCIKSFSIGRKEIKYLIFWPPTEPKNDTVSTLQPCLDTLDDGDLQAM